MPLPTDPLFTQTFLSGSTTIQGQWTLNGTCDFGLRVLRTLPGGTAWSAWDYATGSGVHVAVYDNGFDYTHADIAGNYDASRHVFMDGVSGTINDPIWNGPQATTSRHGTAVMGLIAADNNGSGMVGVAHDAGITGVSGGSVNGYAFTAGQLNSMRHFDVVNHSWGSSGGVFFNSFGVNFVAGCELAAGDGRDGLGSIIVKSAGNDRAQDDNTFFEQSDQSRHSIVVAATLDTGVVSSYSSPGASVLVAACGSPLQGTIVSTDITGAPGSDGGDYTQSFNGTSAAAPLLSGVAALLVDINPTLGWRDAQEIFSLTARSVGSGVGGAPVGAENRVWFHNGGDDWNGGGRHYSMDYGYGLVDAGAAVRLAEGMLRLSGPATSANEVTATASAQIGGNPMAGTVLIPDGSGGLNMTFTMAAAVTVESIVIDFGVFTHNRGRDLVMTLVSPTGTSVQFLANDGNPGANNAGTTILNMDVSTVLQTFRGENAAGTWTLSIQDTDASTITIASMTTPSNGWFTEPVTLSVNGSLPGANDTYYYTDEYETVRTSGGRGTLTDGDGGTDTLNFAARAQGIAGLTLDASGGAGGGSIGGLAGNADLAIAQGTVIENVVGSWFNDNVTGNDANNVLIGLRGHDSLDGGEGNDQLIGGLGDDTLIGGGGDDVMLGGESSNVTNGGFEGVAASVTPGANGYVTVTGLDGWTIGGGGAVELFVANPDGSPARDRFAIDLDTNPGNGSISQTLNGVTSGSVYELRFDIARKTSGNSAQLEVIFGGQSIGIFTPGTSWQTYELQLVAGSGNGSNLLEFREIGVADSDGTWLDNVRVFAGGVPDPTADGNDLMNGGTGADLLGGGAGNDVAAFTDLTGLATSSDYFNGSFGEDTLIVDWSSATSAVTWAEFGVHGFNSGNTGFSITYQSQRLVYREIEHLSLETGSGNDTVRGTHGDDIITTGGGDDTILASEGNDTISGGAGVDTIVRTLTSAADLARGWLAGGAFSANWTGIEQVRGLYNPGADHAFTGGAGGSVFIVGGNANDSLTVDRANSDDAWFDAGAGDADLLVMDWSTASSAITYSEAALAWPGTPSHGYYHTQIYTTADAGAAGGSSQMRFRLVERFQLAGGGGDDDLRGAALTDTLTGGGGNDTLRGGGGADFIHGGAGIDLVIQNRSDATAAIVLSGASQQTTPAMTADGSIWSGLERFYLITGSGGDNINLQGVSTTWMAGVQDIETRDGDDRVALDLNSGSEAYATGGNGTDVLRLNWAAATGNITHTVTATSSVGFGAYRSWELYGSTGAAGANLAYFAEFERFELIGGSGHDDLRGAALTDTLTGGGGNDTLRGGGGADTFAGGAGVDQVIQDRSGIGVDFVLDAQAARSVATATADGSSWLGLEAYALITGSGNDVLDLAGMTASFLDILQEFQSGAGNDRLEIDLRAMDDAWFVAGDGEDTLVMDWSMTSSNIVHGVTALNSGVFAAYLGFNFYQAATALSGYDGAHSLYFHGTERYVLTGGSGHDDLRGGALGDTLNGGAGNDVLRGGGGADTFAGGSGLDFVIQDRSDAGDALVIEGLAQLTGADVTADGSSFQGIEVFALRTGGGNDRLNLLGIAIAPLALDQEFLAGAGDDQLDIDLAGADDVFFAGGSGSDTLVMDWSAATADITRAGTAASTTTFGAYLGWTTYSVAHGGVGFGGAQVLHHHDVERFRLIGGAGNDQLAGALLDDTLTGGAGADTLTGDAGDDQLAGGAGADTLDGGGGHDVARYDDADHGDLVIDLGNAANNTGAAAGDVYVDIEAIIGGAGHDTITGTAGVNTLSGGAGADRLFGLDGADSLNGGDGDDALHGGLGADSLNGGAGIDIARYDDANYGNLVISLASPAGNTGAAAGDVFVDIEGVAGGAGNDTLTGNGGDNVLEGGGGADSLRGGGGNDRLEGGHGNDFLDGGTGINTLAGGTGDDTYYAYGAGDVLVEAAGEGIDLVNAFVDLTLDAAAEIERLVGRLTTGMSLSGSDSANRIEGNSGADTLAGLGGADQLLGLGGDDNLNGGEGNDTLTGGAGNDTLTGGNGLDIASYADAIAGVSVDLRITTAQATGGAGSDLLTLIEGLTGSAYVDTLVGGSGGDQLNGGSGNDTLRGFGGNDTINGGSGDDFIDAGTGLNTIAGGTGSDTIYIYGSADTVIEAIGEGNDTLQVFATSYTLGAGQAIERIIARLGTATALTGNELNQRLDGGGGGDTLIGLDGNDTLAGAGGNDDMRGGLGNDTYYVTDAGDLITEAAGEGTIDRVWASTGYTLGAGVEVEFLHVLAGSPGLTLAGNELGNRIYGATGADTLSGGAGADTLTGNDGDDRLAGGDGLDVLFGNAGADTFVLANLTASADSIRDFGSGLDRLELSAALFGGGLAAGALAATRFSANATGLATTTDQRLIYNTGSGELWFDADGSDAGAAIRIATLTTRPALALGDFDIVA